MKAILKANRKVIVDVMWDEKLGESFGNVLLGMYKDKHNDKYYHEDDLDFVEYYGG